MSQDDTSEVPNAIDEIMKKIGNAGLYQKRFNIAFNLILSFLAAMPYLNLYISLATPDHWCHVPGRENTNYTISEWKNLTIPKEVDSKGLLSYSKCKRYDTWNTSSSKNEVKCDNGWDYDHTWYDQTAPTQNNWVCDNDMVPSDTIALGFVGELVGTMVMGHVADNYGRMPIFFASLIIAVSGRVMLTLTSEWVYAFLFFSFFSSLVSTALTQGPFVIAMEICRPKDRALVGVIVCFGTNMGLSTIPLLMWLLRDWVPFIIVSTLPCAIYLFSRPWIIESPRWLASKGRLQDCIKELSKVAKTNKTEMPPNAEAMLKKYCEQNGHDKHQSVLGLISSPRLAKNTVLLITCWCIVQQIYVSLTINVTNLDGNPFLNYLFQALAELPAYVIAKYLSDRYGRRCNTFISFTLSSLSCFAIIFLINDTSMAPVINYICIFMKFSVTLAYFSINLQALEIYPTCIRQIGCAVGGLFGSATNIIVPYIIALGVSVNATLPFVIYLLCSILGAICCIFLPETHGHDLPETLADAKCFGADQDFWGRPKTRRNIPDGADRPLTEQT